MKLSFNLATRFSPSPFNVLFSCEYLELQYEEKIFALTFCLNELDVLLLFCNDRKDSVVHFYYYDDDEEKVRLQHRNKQEISTLI